MSYIMNSAKRREYIKNLLNSTNVPKKGQELAEDLNVTRQVIVKDIAILRAEGVSIIATPEGYMIPNNNKKGIEKIIAVSHMREDIENELQIIVKYGGLIKDVIVEHPLYGEIKGMLMLKTPYDVQKFMERIKEYNAEPLSIITRGVHLHTIESENEESMKKILNELKNKGYLVE